MIMLQIVLTLWALADDFNKTCKQLEYCSHQILCTIIYMNSFTHTHAT